MYALLQIENTSQELTQKLINISPQNKELTALENRAAALRANGKSQAELIREGVRQVSPRHVNGGDLHARLKSGRADLVIARPIGSTTRAYADPRVRT